jgi:hypothetical protein
MRSTIFFLVAAVLLGETQVARAQSSNSYPWCASYTTHRAATTACHFTNHDQCMATGTASADIAIEIRTITRRIRANPIPTDNRKNGGRNSRKSTQVGRPVPRRGESECRAPTQ